MDFPHPASPTRAKISPLPMLKSTPSTASAHPQRLFGSIPRQYPFIDGEIHFEIFYINKIVILHLTHLAALICYLSGKAGSFRFDLTGKSVSRGNRFSLRIFILAFIDAKTISRIKGPSLRTEKSYSIILTIIVTLYCQANENFSGRVYLMAALPVNIVY